MNTFRETQQTSVRFPMTVDALCLADESFPPLRPTQEQTKPIEALSRGLEDHETVTRAMEKELERHWPDLSTKQGWIRPLGQTPPPGTSTNKTKAKKPAETFQTGSQARLLHVEVF